jgi:uncharacterized membrane protein
MTGAEQPDLGERSAPRPGGHPLEIWISTVLRIGVLTAGAVIATGLVLYLIRGPDPGRPGTVDQLTARGGQPIHVSVHSIVDGLGSFRPGAIILLGLLILILTPLMRVAMTIALFLLEQEWIFVAITGVVLVILVFGLVGVGT